MRKFRALSLGILSLFFLLLIVRAATNSGPPVITMQPVSKVANEKSRVTFSVRATGAPTLKYQWSKDSQDIPGATSSTLTLTGVNGDSAGIYRVTVSNGQGSKPSDEVTLTVNLLPKITSGPEAATVIEGAPVEFKVVATGTGPLSYQWKKSGRNIAGANSDTYTIPAAASTDAGQYSVLVSNMAGKTTSANALLTVILAPVIKTQPKSVTVVQGKSATFKVALSRGTAPLTYQWFLNDQPIEGATASTLTLTDIMPEDEGDYVVEISNPAGTATSDPATLTVLVPPMIEEQPQSQTVNAGDMAFFEVVVSGSEPLKYQWRKNGVNIPNATESFLEIDEVQPGQAGTYSVVVSNGAGKVTSDNAILTVIPTDLNGFWNIIQFRTPSFMSVQPFQNGQDYDLVNGDQFKVRIGNMTAKDGNMSGKLEEAFTGTYEQMEDGMVDAMIEAGESLEMTFFLNAARDSMVRVGRSGAAEDDSGQELLLFQRAPASLSVADLAGSWRLSQVRTPAEIALQVSNPGDHPPRYMLSGGNSFRNGSGILTASSTGNAEGQMEEAFQAKLSVLGKGVVQLMITSGDGSETLKGYINASKDTMIIVSSANDGEDNRQELIVAHRLPGQLSTELVAGHWNMAQLRTPQSVVLNEQDAGNNNYSYSLDGGDSFATGLGDLTIEPDGTVSGSLEEPFTGTCHCEPDGTVTVTLDVGGGSAQFTFQINAGLNQMVLVDGIFNSDENHQEIIIFQRAPE